MFISIDIEPAVRAHVILLKPRFKAVDVKVMLTSQKEYLVAIDIRLQANSTDSVRVLFHNSLYRYLLEYFLSHSKLLFDLFVHILIIDLFESVDVHPLDRGRLTTMAILVLVVVLKDTLPLVVPVDEVKVILP